MLPAPPFANTPLGGRRHSFVSRIAKLVVDVLEQQ